MPIAATMDGFRAQSGRDRLKGTGCAAGSHTESSLGRETGEVVVWKSDHCYVVSDPPSPGEPDFLKHARVTRAGCQQPPGPTPGELFKSLPTYTRYHPQ